MKFLTFDTETSSLPGPSGAPLNRQPHIVQLAALLIDTEDQEERVLNCLVRPVDWTINPGAEAVHGISMEKAAATGVPIAAAMTVFKHLCEAADVIVAHNISFDLKLVEFECARLNLANPVSGKKQFCTMNGSRNICRLPGKYRGQFKAPKLTEAYHHFFGEDFYGAHDAMADVRACARIYQHLQNESYTSRNHPGAGH